MFIYIFQILLYYYYYVVVMNEIMDLFVFIKLFGRHLLLSICLVCEQCLCYVHNVV